MYFYDVEMQAWWWTSAANYPFIYVFDPKPDLNGIDIGDAWLWFDRNEFDERSFEVMTGPFDDQFVSFAPRR